MAYRGYERWDRYVSVSERRKNAAREVKKLKRSVHPLAPVMIPGRTIAHTLWGKAWCDNLERYSDFANRLPRGRTYVRNGSVLDLQLAPGEVAALISGSRIYRTTIKVSAVPKARWNRLCSDCAHGIDSLVELLQGRFSRSVMERMCRRGDGLFPTPAEIEFSCNCPDWASMCKHVAAALYGVGARLDERPELLFRLRKVDENALVAKAGKALPLSTRAPEQSKPLASDSLSEMFGIEIGSTSTEQRSAGGTTRTTAPRPRKKLRSTAAKASSRTKARNSATSPAARKPRAATTARTPAASSDTRKKAATSISRKGAGGSTAYKPASSSRTAVATVRPRKQRSKKRTSRTKR